jgi:disulfide bond formation protein DsbB
MSLDLYSYFLSISVLALGSVALLTLIGYITSTKVRTQIQSIPYFHIVKLIGFLAIFSTIGVLVYQLYYEVEVCELCWWQRIFMFPIDIIVLVSLYYKTRTNHVIIGILAAFGTFFAGYHYYYHFRGWVLGEIVSLPCSVGGLLPACTDNNGILQFGFITIPFMALIVFLTILWLSYVAHQTKK